MINEILIGIIALAIAAGIMVPLNRKFFSKTKNIYKKEVSVISLIFAAVFSVGYWVQVFVVEGERIGGNHEGYQGLTLSDALPLYLIVFTMYLILMVIPMSVSAILIYPVFRRKRKK